jgi:hypothetical protein
LKIMFDTDPTAAKHPLRLVQATMNRVRRQTEDLPTLPIHSQGATTHARGEGEHFLEAALPIRIVQAAAVEFFKAMPARAVARENRHKHDRIAGIPIDGLRSFRPSMARPPVDAILGAVWFHR